MSYRFEIYKDRAGEFRVRFKYNAEIMFSSEGYSSKASALNLIRSVKLNAPDAEVIDTTPTTKQGVGILKEFPSAWLIRVTRSGQSFIMSRRLYETEEQARKVAARASKRLFNRGASFEVVALYEKSPESGE